MPVDPFLKWAGGKRALIGQILPWTPNIYNRYYEPFVGGGALYFHLQPKSAVLSDLNKDLVNCYVCIRDCPDDVLKLLEKHQKLHCKAHFLRQRKLLKYGTKPERAARIIYLNKTCFNGLYRVNKEGVFNTSIGSYKNPPICNETSLHLASLALQGADLKCCDFAAHELKEGDFAYLDPPYDGGFVEYTKEGFDDLSQLRLRDWFAASAKKGASLVLSNSDTPFTRNLYKDFRIVRVTASRAISCKAESRNPAPEILVIANCHV